LFERAAGAAAGAGVEPLNLERRTLNLERSEPGYPTPVQWKYIVVADPHGVERVILFDPAFTHEEMVPCCCAAVGAGFVMIYEGNLVVPEIPSETLRLGPRKEDRGMIEGRLGGGNVRGIFGRGIKSNT
jgi:hypothetical protein